MQLIDLNGTDILNRFDHYLCDKINKIQSIKTLKTLKSHQLNNKNSSIKSKPILSRNPDSFVESALDNIDEREAELSSDDDDENINNN